MGNKMAFEFTEDLLLEIKEAYETYDKNSEDGKVDVQEMRRLLRSLGQNPTDADISRMLNDLKADDQGTLEFPDFLKMMSKMMKDKDPGNELREAFGVLDEEGTGMVDVEELKHLLVDLLEESEKEVKAMIKDVGVRDGQINYEDFIQF